MRFDEQAEGHVDILESASNLEVFRLSPNASARWIALCTLLSKTPTTKILR